MQASSHIGLGNAHHVQACWYQERMSGKADAKLAPGAAWALMLALSASSLLIAVSVCLMVCHLACI